MKNGLFVSDDFFKSMMWTGEKFTRAHAYLDLLAMANRRTSTSIYNGKLKTFRRGCIYRSNTGLSERFHWSTGKVNSFLNDLKDAGMIKIVGRGIEREIEMTEYESFNPEGGNNEEYFSPPGADADEDNDDDSWFDKM